MPTMTKFDDYQDNYKLNNGCRSQTKNGTMLRYQGVSPKKSENVREEYNSFVLKSLERIANKNSQEKDAKTHKPFTLTNFAQKTPMQSKHHPLDLQQFLKDQSPLESFRKEEDYT